MSPVQPPNGVLVTMTEVYQETRRVGDAVLVLTGKVEGLSSLGEQMGDHESRIRSLEARRWPLEVLASALGVLGAVCGVWALLGR